MNRPDDDRPDARDELTDRLAGTYRAQREAPPPALDALILAKAKRSAEQRRIQRLRALGGSFALAATLVLGLALALQVLITPAPLPEPAPAEMRDDAAAKARESMVAPLAEPTPVPARQAPATAAAAEAAALPYASIEPAAPAATAPASPAVAPPATAEHRAAISATLDESMRLDRLEVTGARIKRESDAAPRPLDEWLAEISRLEQADERERATAELAALCLAYPTERRCAKE